MVVAGAALAALACGCAHAAGVQQVSATAQQIASQVTVSVGYHTTPENQPVTGLGLRLHFDSSALGYAAVDGLYRAGLVAGPVAQNDVEDFDQDPATDKYLLVAWADLQGTWPANGSAVSLYGVSFKALAPVSTRIRFTASDTAAGYAFAAEPLAIGLK